MAALSNKITSIIPVIPFVLIGIGFLFINKIDGAHSVDTVRYMSIRDFTLLGSQVFVLITQFILPFLLFDFFFTEATIRSDWFKRRSEYLKNITPEEKYLENKNFGIKWTEPSPYVKNINNHKKNNRRSILILLSPFLFSCLIFIAGVIHQKTTKEIYLTIIASYLLLYLITPLYIKLLDPKNKYIKYIPILKTSLILIMINSLANFSIEHPINSQTDNKTFHFNYKGKGRSFKSTEVLLDGSDFFIGQKTLKKTDSTEVIETYRLKKSELFNFVIKEQVIKKTLSLKKNYYH